MMRWLIVFLSLAGTLVSALALQVHYSTATEPCSINARWDCGVVNHSPFAVIGPVPVAVLGIAGYLAIGLLAWFRLRFTLLLTVFAGFVFAFRLSMIEQYALGVWCLYCAISQGIIAVILMLSIGWFMAEYLRLRRTANRLL